MVAAAAIAVVVAFATGSTESRHFAKFAGGDPDAAASQKDTPGEGPVGGLEAYFSAQRTYPADEIPPAVAEKPRRRSTRSRGRTPRTATRRQGTQVEAAIGPHRGRDPARRARVLGRDEHDREPRDGAAGRSRLRQRQLPLWVGVSGGGVWRTDNALGDNPDWKQLDPATSTRTRSAR